IRQLGCAGAAPGAVRKNVDFGETCFLGYLAGCDEVRFGLAGEPKNNICRERRLIEDGAQTTASFQESRATITAFHEPQDAVRAALQTQVQVRADPRRLSEGLYKLTANFRGFKAAQANAKVSR